MQCVSQDRQARQFASLEAEKLAIGNKNWVNNFEGIQRRVTFASAPAYCRSPEAANLRSKNSAVTR